jgi:ATP-dependent Clp protease ATP-binding subunit ClpA
VVVTGEDIMHILSNWTGVPLNRMEQSEQAKRVIMFSVQKSVDIAGRSQQ